MIRTSPYTAVFSITPDINAETGVGAMGCALGSQRWSGTIPDFMPNPNMAVTKTHTRTLAVRLAPAERIASKVRFEACPRKRKKHAATAAAPTCIMSR